jgi:hypothetical protein
MVGPTYQICKRDYVEDRSNDRERKGPSPTRKLLCLLVFWTNSKTYFLSNRFVGQAHLPYGLRYKPLDMA